MGPNKPRAEEDNTPEPSYPSDDDEYLPKKSRNKKGKKKKKEEDDKIRVGDEYQANLPEMMTQPKKHNYAHLNLDQESLMWSPPSDIAESKVEEFINIANGRHGYNEEQALGMLIYHGYNFEKAITDLANYVPFREDEWSREDHLLLDQALQIHAKNFQAIKTMFPGKSIADLVKFYYSRKKKKSRSQFGAMMKEMVEGSSACGNSNGEKKAAKRYLQVKKGSSSSPSSSSSNGIHQTSHLNCQNCLLPCDALKSTPVGIFCVGCFLHWRRTGILRPTQGPQYISKSSRRPPSNANGMYINRADLLKLAAQDFNASTTPCDTSSDILYETNRDIKLLQHQIQANKQKIEELNLARKLQEA